MPDDTLTVNTQAADTLISQPTDTIVDVEAYMRQNYSAEIWIDSVGRSAFGNRHYGHSEGVEGVRIEPSPGTDSALLSLLLGTVIVAAIFSKAVFTVFKGYKENLWKIRERRNIFDEEQKISLPVTALLALIFIVYGGVALYVAIGTPGDNAFIGALKTTAVLGAYYIFQLCAYSTVGYAFTDKQGCTQWLTGFSASHACMGVLMILPVLLMLCLPICETAALYTCTIVYIIGRIIFIFKGFRIFYRKTSSLLYFILYLCTLEIIPVFALYHFLMHLE